MINLEWPWAYHNNEETTNHDGILTASTSSFHSTCALIQRPSNSGSVAPHFRPPLAAAAQPPVKRWGFVQLCVGKPSMVLVGYTTDVGSPRFTSSDNKTIYLTQSITQFNFIRISSSRTYIFNDSIKSTNSNRVQSLKDCRKYIVNHLLDSDTTSSAGCCWARCCDSARMELLGLELHHVVDTLGLEIDGRWRCCCSTWGYSQWWGVPGVQWKNRSVLPNCNPLKLTCQCPC